MLPRASAALAALTLFGLAGSAAATSTGSLPPPTTPPSQSTWPSYPKFPLSSCYPSPLARKSKASVMRFAPSYLPPPPRSKPRPQALLDTVLAGLPDRSLVHGGRFGPLPVTVRKHLRGWFGPSPQPRNALWLYLDAPVARQRTASSSEPQQKVDFLRAEWQATLVAGAIHDLMCTNRERQLVGWNITATDGGQGGYQASIAFGQRFPNPSEAEFRARVDTAAGILGLTVVSVTLLRPLGLAPDVVLQAPNRLAFMNELGSLRSYLAPGGTFEGFFIEAEDPDGIPFYASSETSRGVAMGGAWAWDPCQLKGFSHPFGAAC
jgi:hypothetical protein